MKTLNPLQITANQYRLYLALLGSYLTVHFAYLSRYAVELFSNQGMLADAAQSPLFGILPTLFQFSDNPFFVMGCTIFGAFAALAMVFGRASRWAAAYMLVLLISLFARNPLIANPALPYVGFMLLLHLFVPKIPRGNDPARNDWRLPTHLFFAATAVLAISYSYSGYTKLLSPGWVSGDTLALVLENPLARDWMLRDLFLALPAIVLKGITWFILVVELIFAPLYLLRRARFGLWLGMLFVQFGFLFLLSFPDLTIPMLIFHLLTFDPRWIAPKPLDTQSTLRYDGECAVCHGAVKFALQEVPNDSLHFRPMQHDGITDPSQMNSWELNTATVTYVKSNALIRLLEACGGLWRVAAVSIRLVPKAIRDWLYDRVANQRRRLRAPEGLCPLVKPELRERFS